MSQFPVPDLVPRTPWLDKPRESPGLPEGIGAAIRSEWLPAWAFRRLELETYAPDSSYDPFADNGKAWSELTQGLDPDFWSAFGDARSMPQALKIREQMLSVQRARQTLGQMGWTGTALQMGANIVDPANLSTMLIPGVGPASLGAKAGRLGWIARSGLAVGLPNAALESIRAMEDPQYGPMGVAAAGLGGFGFGAGTAMAAGQGRLAGAIYGGGGQALGTALGTIPNEDLTLKEAMWSIGISGALGAPFGALSSRMHKELELEAIKDLGGQLDDASRAYFKEVLPESGRVEDFVPRVSDIQKEIQSEVDAAAVPFDGDGAEVGGPKPMPVEQSQADAISAPSETVSAGTAVPPAETGRPVDVVTGGGGAGAATQGNIILNKWVADEMYDFKATPNDAVATYAKARIGMAASFSRSSVPADIRAVGNMVFEDVMQKADGSPSRDSAERSGRRFGQVVMTDYIRKTEPSVNAWLEANGVNFMGRRTAIDRLFDEVGRAQRRPTPHSDPNIRALVDAQREAIERTWAMGYRMGVPGFDKFIPSDLYVTRIWSLPAIAKAVAKYNSINPVVDVVAESMQRMQQNLSTQEARVLALAMLREIQQNKTGLGLDPSIKFNSSSREALAAIIKENVKQVTDAEIDSILNKVHRTEKEGTISRSMWRVRLDETYRSGTTSLSVEDLLENNAFNVLDRYIKEITGAGVVSEVLRGYSKYIGQEDNPIKSIDEFRNVIAKRVDAGIGSGKDPNTKNAALIDTLAHMLSHIRGAPLNSGARADFLRVLRKAQFSRVMNFAGLAQVPEVANAITQAGFGTFVRSLPNLVQMFKKAANGELANDVAREAEALHAHEAGTIRGSITERMDFSDYEPGTIGATERVFDRLATATKHISGLNVMNTVLSRTVGILAEQKWYDIAKSGKLPNAARLAAMGLDEKMAGRITAEINKHSASIPGTRTVKVLNPGMWDDQEAASALIVAMDKWSRRVVQQNDLGQMSEWMTKDWGQTLIQFRTFMVSAYEKQLLYPIATRDWNAFSSWATTMFMGGLTYVGATYAQSWGMSNKDKREFLKKKLDTTTIGMAAFNRGGWSSIIPVGWDTMATWSGSDLPQFSTSRMSGLGGDPITGNPSTAMLYDLVYKLPKVAYKTIKERRLPTKSEFRTATSFGPFQNAIGIRNVINAISGELKEDAR